MTGNHQEPSHYLLAIAIGPVQDFIAASRKARDLWFGSEMLSDLARHVAMTLVSVEGTTIEPIFPPRSALTTPAEETPPSVANKLLLHVVSGDPATLERTGREATTAFLRQAWDVVARRYQFDGVVNEDLLRAQLDDFVEWYAAWVPYHPDANDPARHYRDQRERVELLLAGRKTLRDFLPAQGVDGVPKSALDPSRETVIQHDLIRLMPPDKQISVRRRLRLKGNEQLDGVSLLKRLGGTNRLVSVSRVAVDPFIRRVQEDGHEAELQHLNASATALADTDLVEGFSPHDQRIAHYKAFPYDCQLFYARNLNEVDTRDLSSTEMTAAQTFCEEVAALTKVLAASPPRYFAVLAADGDRMGKALSGLDTPDLHRTFSTELAEFARLAGEIVRRHYGAMIYSGGDDVLAFLPLDTALPCTHALARAFKGVMADALPEFQDTELPTLSAGLAIGHYAEHLQVLLDRARDAEKAAKKDRNALAVSFTAHSGGGGTRTVAHTWHANPVRDRWWFAINALRLDAIPDGAIYELDRLHRELQPLVDHVDGSVIGIAAAEAKRIVDRKRTGSGSKRVEPWVANELDRRLDTGSPKGNLAALRDLVDELYIARQILPAITTGGDSVLARWTDREEGPGVSLEPPPPESAPADSTEVPA